MCDIGVVTTTLVGVPLEIPELLPLEVQPAGIPVDPGTWPLSPVEVPVTLEADY